MRTISVPYHLDEYVSGFEAPLPPERTITAELADGDVWARMADLYRPVADTVADNAQRGERSLVMSSDCTTSLAVVAGLQHAGQAPSVVWFDAHGDVQTLETSTSGYLGGIPLRLIAGYRTELIADAIDLTPVAEDAIVLVDARDLDPPERAYLERSRIRHVAIDELATDVLPSGPIYLHIDLDVINPEYLSGQLFPAAGGPTVQAVAQAVSRVVDVGRVAAVGLGCTWRPGHGAAARVQAVVDAAIRNSPAPGDRPGGTFDPKARPAEYPHATRAPRQPPKGPTAPVTGWLSRLGRVSRISAGGSLMIGE
ncbi:arginase family protein [Haloechinothrix salitolerans]|uniref:Arginase family protein n=1 Tax=Haloechinothrix salitolerans TaxID=926830 RepID=A0ABW2C1I8_9PSEU